MANGDNQENVNTQVNDNNQENVINADYSVRPNRRRRIIYGAVALVAAGTIGLYSYSSNFRDRVNNLLDIERDTPREQVSYGRNPESGYIIDSNSIKIYEIKDPSNPEETRYTIELRAKRKDQQNKEPDIEVIIQDLSEEERDEFFETYTKLSDSGEVELHPIKTIGNVVYGENNLIEQLYPEDLTSLVLTTRGDLYVIDKQLQNKMRENHEHTIKHYINRESMETIEEECDRRLKDQQKTVETEKRIAEKEVKISKLERIGKKYRSIIDKYLPKQKNKKKKKGKNKK